jgi:hypothetical protein
MAADPRSEIATAQAELQEIEQRIAAKLQDSFVVQDKNVRATLRLEIQSAERQKTAATRRLKAAQVKLRKAEIASSGNIGSTAGVAQEGDWTEHLDAQCGRNFYYNVKTGETSWTKPSPAAQTTSANAVAAGTKAVQWTEHLDPQSGNTFYYNATTGETSWTKPSQASPAPAPQEDWTEHTDPASGNIFFYNAMTGETSWTRPDPVTQQPLTEGITDFEWTENIDPASGQKYYFNTITQESSWTRPSSCNTALQQVQPTSAVAA